jgi:hypothetical protein
MLAMPKALFRIVAVVVLALTIPVQGVAAVAAGQCMAFGHHGDAAAQQDHEHAQDHSHDDLGAATSADQGSEDSRCGPCAACCASASIACPAGISILSSPSNVKYFFSQLPPPGVQPDGLDRPPLVL